VAERSAHLRDKNGRLSQTPEMKTGEYPGGSEAQVTGRRASLGLASRENWGCVPDRFDDQSFDGITTNYKLAKVIFGFGINCQNGTKIPGLVESPQSEC
jgi:hypothetical protein